MCSSGPDQPLASDLPLIREIRATLTKCLENGFEKCALPYPDLATYNTVQDMPPLYSGCFGLGSRDLQPEGVVGAIENMLDGGAKKKFFYLSIDFIRSKPSTPKANIYQQEIKDRYPTVKALAVKGSENPNLLPQGAITVRMHSVGGWGAITTGKNLAITLYELLGYDIKANPKYGSEKKGPANHLLPLGRTRTHSHQLRVLLCRCGALPGSERFQSLESCLWLETGRYVHHPERPRNRGSRLGINP